MYDAEFLKGLKITPTEITLPKPQGTLKIDGRVIPGATVTGIQFSTSDQEDLIKQLYSAGIGLLMERRGLRDSLRIADSVNSYLRGELEKVTDSRNTWRTWCLILAAGMALGIVLQAGVWWG